MISYLEAQKKIVQQARPLPVEKKAVQESTGCVIASDLRAPLNLPGFDNSAMDGFVFRGADTASASVEFPVRLKICGSLRAGLSQKINLSHGKVFRIMTGAAIPNGADTVLEKEKARIHNNFLVFTEPVKRGRHVRYQGEEITKGARLPLRGLEMTPGSVGFLSSLGVGHVSIYRKPKISLIATGDEIVSCGHRLRRGQIYDSNTPMLLEALKPIAVVSPRLVQKIADQKTALKTALSKSILRSDLVILTGGVSVGDYDHAKVVFEELGVKKVFWKVLQKPGKPIYFGTKGHVLVFGLPGNPASVHTCFYQYVYPAIRLLSGHGNFLMRKENLMLKEDVRPDQEKTIFLKAKIDRSEDVPRCEVLGHQGSHMLSSLCRSQGFIVVPPGNKILKKGQKVFFHYLPEGTDR